MDATQALKAYELRCLALDAVNRSIDCCLAAGLAADELVATARALANGLFLYQPPPLSVDSNGRPDRAD